jgi:FkbM family methyltransferase
MLFNHKNLTSIANDTKKRIPEINYLGISDLQKMPTFFDWVACKVNTEIFFSMFLAGSDDGVALRFFWNGQYEKSTLEIWSYFASLGGVIIDIGAHTGAYTLAANAANKDATVYSFEPHFMNFARLNLNMRGNGLNSNNAFMLGVGEKNTILPFSVSTRLDYLSTGGSIGSRDNALISEIKVVALDNFFQKDKDKINLIKMDVEGHEAACLRGMLDIVKKSRPIIFLECIDETSSAEVSLKLSNLGYSFFLIDDITGEVSKVKSITAELDSSGKIIMHRLNRIAMPDDRLLNAISNS